MKTPRIEKRGQASGGFNLQGQSPEHEAPWSYDEVCCLHKLIDTAALSLLSDLKRGLEVNYRESYRGQPIGDSNG